MKRIFVDTSFLIASHYESDPFYDRARYLIDEGMEKYMPFQMVITDYIFDEFVTILMRKGSRTHACQMGQRLLSHSRFELAWITVRYFHKAWDVFSRFVDKKWSFTDCTSYVWIQQNQPDFCLATDSDFDEFGLVPNLVRT